ncbi:MAG: molybdenum cofactor guanylyltransferase [Clostridiales Family XIII bacterium]|jgi:molybdopterin-guanine dinucleotide biosynthesis protein A|nr:molybdenum cofactor guanylyltransferase [Clostridiales Family XIII bacterium]
MSACAGSNIAVILAGGQSRRMGRDKLELPYGNETLLRRAARLYSGCFDRVYLSVSNGEKYADLGVERIEDVFRGCGPMAGLHAALSKTDADGVFLLAADLPFANPEAARFLTLRGRGRDACIIRTDDGYYEPLFGYYARSMLPRAQEALAAGLYAMTSLYRAADVCFVSIAELGGLWRENMLLNINSPADYERAIIETDKGRDAL